MFLRVLFGIAALLLGLRPATAVDGDVDLALVLAVDVSGSMDRDEQELQRSGYVEAFRNGEVIGAIGQGMRGRIAVTYVEWAGPPNQKVVVPWRVIDGADAGRAFASELAAAPLSRYRGTSISGGLAFALPILNEPAFASVRKVIDISGDGPNNMGGPVLDAREAVLRAGITINGLPIVIKKPNGFYSIPALDIYYEDCVIGGPGAFLVSIESKHEFVSAIRRKLVLEVAGRMPGLIRASDTTSKPRIDCLIGEKLREQWMRE
jgi:hypothetical protein